MNMKTLVFLLCTGLLPWSQSTLAEPQTPLQGLTGCLRNSQNISQGIAAPGEYKVIHGPYSTRCATVMHRFQLRSQEGGALPVTVEKLMGGSWAVVGKGTDPAQVLGAGTFRAILDNTDRATSTAYRGSFSVPL